MKILRLFVLFALVCFALSSATHAVVPPPDGAYPNFTTAEGQNALQGLTTGAGNTALGAFSLFGTTTGSFNTAVGAGALDLNTGDNNTAVGVASLLLNTGTNNTGVGVDALGLNIAGEKIPPLAHSRSTITLQATLIPPVVFLHFMTTRRAPATRPPVSV